MQLSFIDHPALIIDVRTRSDAHSSLELLIDLDYCTEVDAVLGQSYDCGNIVVIVGPPRTKRSHVQRRGLGYRKDAQPTAAFQSRTALLCAVIV